MCVLMELFIDTREPVKEIELEFKTALPSRLSGMLALHSWHLAVAYGAFLDEMFSSSPNLLLVSSGN